MFLDDYGESVIRKYAMVEYRKHGFLHRPHQEGPAEISYYQGKGTHPYKEVYWFKGLMHRPSHEGPAQIWYFISGNVSVEIYYDNDKRHRDPKEGPAFIEYDDSGAVVNKYYYCNDYEVPCP